MIYNTIEVTSELVDNVIEVEAELMQEVEITHTNTDDYERLNNLPKLNGTTVKGDKSLSDYGYKIMTNNDIEELFNTVF